MKKVLILVSIVLTMVLFATPLFAANAEFKLGNEVLFSDFSTYGQQLVHKRVGLLTNQTGVNSSGESTIDKLHQDSRINLVALFGPEHGIDGLTSAGSVVQSGVYQKYNIPVYSLYGATRTPTKAMMDTIDVLVVDLQDIGARSYTYVSTVQYCMKAAAQYNKEIVILDRPNPLGGNIVEGDVMDPEYITFVGCDIMPMAHGMTMGELAKFFNRKISSKLSVVPMQGYTRDMIWQDTGLTWVPTSPNIPDIQSAFCYIATGMGEGTTVGQQDKFKWVGSAGLDSKKFTASMNALGIPGVTFVAESRGSAGGARLNITDYHIFNPTLVGYGALSVAKMQKNFSVPKSTTETVMFEKIMGGTEMGKWLDQKYTLTQMQAAYKSDLDKFKNERKQYLIYGTGAQTPPDISNPNPPAVPGTSVVELSRNDVEFDITVIVNGLFVEPLDGMGAYANKDGRTMVAMRSIGDSLGAIVKYDAANRTVLIEKSSRSVSFRLDSKVINTSSGQITMDTSPSVIDGRVFLPLRYVGESLNCDVNWYTKNRTVTITNK